MSQPYIDLDSVFPVVFQQTSVKQPTDYGDLGSIYQNDDWTAVLAFERIKSGSQETLMGIQAQFGTNHGRAGAMIRLDSTNELDAFAVVGNDVTGTADTGTVTFGPGRHLVLVEKVGSSLNIYNQDGVLIGTGPLGGSGMDWVTTTATKTTLGALHSSTVTPPLTSRLVGNIDEAIYIPAGVLVDQRVALLRLARERLTGPASSRRELFMNNNFLVSNSANGPILLPLTKQGPLLEGSDPSYYEGVRYVDVHQFNEEDWKVWTSTREYQAGNLIHAGVARFDSADGLNWSAPDLGLISYGGNTNNSLILDSAGVDTLNQVLFDEEAPASRRYLFLLEKVNNVISPFLYQSSSPDLAPTLLKNVGTGLGLPGGSEAKGLIKRSDGRYVIFYNHGQSADRRSVGAIISKTTDPAGEWLNLGDYPALIAPNDRNEFYSVRPQFISQDLWLLFVSRYSSPDQIGHIDLYASTDEGLTVMPVKSQWLPLGASGEWDDSIMWADKLMRVGNDWRYYYFASSDLHDTPGGLVGAAMGYATTGYGRLAAISGPGEVITKEIKTGLASTLTVNADASANDVTVHILDGLTGAVLSGYGGVIGTDAYGQTYALPLNRIIKIKFTLTAGAKLYSYEVL